MSPATFFSLCWDSIYKRDNVLIICNISLDLHCIVLRIVLIIQSTSVYLKRCLICFIWGGGVLMDLDLKAKLDCSLYKNKVIEIPAAVPV